MRRIALWAVPLLLASPLLAQAPQNAAAVVLSVRGSAVTAIDVSVPGNVGEADLTRDMGEIERWTGWTLGQSTVKHQGDQTSCSASVVSGGDIQGSLNDAIWPLVAALARYGRMGIAVIGVNVATAPLIVDNRYVHFEQSGGQGVQSYQVEVRDTSFRNLEDLRSQTGQTQASTPRHRSFAGAWFLLVVASVAVGVAVFLSVRGLQRARAGGRSFRHR